MPLKNLSNFQRTLEISLTNSEINLILTWSENRIISNPSADQNTTFAICNSINSRQSKTNTTIEIRF